MYESKLRIMRKKSLFRNSTPSELGSVCSPIERVPVLKMVKVPCVVSVYNTQQTRNS